MRSDVGDMAGMTAGSDRRCSSGWRGVTDGAAVSIVCEGDEFSAAGARLAISVDSMGSPASVAVLRSVDATSFHGRVAVLSAVVKIGEAQTRLPAVWIRADGPSGRLEFATSASFPETDGPHIAHRQIELRIPRAATSLAYGVVFGGDRLHADDLILRAVDGRQFGPESTSQDVMAMAIDLIENEALRAEEIDWAAARVHAREVVAEARYPVDLYPTIRVLLAGLGDGHSHFITPEMAYRHRSMGAPTLPAVVESLPDGIGLVRMAGFIGRGETECASFAKEVASRIVAFSVDAENGWVLDLRRNSGGNLWPMLASLTALLGHEVVGGFRSKQGGVREWRAGDRLAESAGFEHAALETAKVAVLLGPKTCSSGEALAVAFHGRPRTRSFGEYTSGLANANTAFDLPDGSQLQLMTAICVDRHGEAFGERVYPDETVISPVEDTDGPLLAAIAWLLEDLPASA